DLPDVDLAVDELTLFGRAAGALAVKGSNQERGRLWRLESASLSNPDGRLTASGTWRTGGADRGVALDANLNVASLGGVLERMGQSDLVSGGKGEITASLDWRDFPWKHDYTALDGQVQAHLANGRLVSVR